MLKRTLALLKYFVSISFEIKLYQNHMLPWKVCGDKTTVSKKMTSGFRVAIAKRARRGLLGPAVQLVVVVRVGGTGLPAAQLAPGAEQLLRCQHIQQPQQAQKCGGNISSGKSSLCRKMGREHGLRNMAQVQLCPRIFSFLLNVHKDTVFFRLCFILLNKANVNLWFLTSPFWIRMVLKQA